MRKRKKPRPITYLALPLVEGAAYTETLETARLLAACVEDLGRVAAYPHGHTPDPQPDPANVKPQAHELRTIGRRMMVGDGEIHERAGVVWLVGDHETVSEQAEWSAEAEIPCERIDPGTLAAYAARGAVLLARAVVPAHESKKRDRCELRSAFHVVVAYLDGAGRVLGSKALSLEPRESDRASPFVARDRQEVCGLQIAMAGGIIAEAMRSRHWKPETLGLLRSTIVVGESAAQAARIAGYSGSTSGASQWATRRIDKAIWLISGILNRRRREAEEAANGTSEEG